MSENEQYQNTLANEHCSNPLNNIPLAENEINRSEQYWNQLVHDGVSLVHDHCSESCGLAQIGMEGGQDIDGHAQPPL